MLIVTRRFLRIEEDSADAVQDAFLTAFRSLNGFQGHSALGTWLHRIVVNVCLMKLRSRLWNREVHIDDMLPTFDDKRLYLWIVQMMQTYQTATGVHLSSHD